MMEYLIVLRLKETIITLFTDANHDGLYDAFDSGPFPKILIMMELPII
jgi:hypothetical protein